MQGSPVHISYRPWGMSIVGPLSHCNCMYLLFIYLLNQLPNMFQLTVVNINKQNTYNMVNATEMYPLSHYVKNW